MPRLFKPPRLADRIFRSYTWRFAVSGPEVFLTFDDGPHPDITPFVLDELKKRGLSATFFCVGENLLRYPEIAERIVDEGHRIGNHTLKHTKGTETHLQEYLEGVAAFDAIYSTPLFRPPYGKMTREQRKAVAKTHRIIMWSWLSYDYDKDVSVATILEQGKRIQPGDILLLHDNPKIVEKQRTLLPALLDLLEKKGLKTALIPV